MLRKTESNTSTLNASIHTNQIGITEILEYVMGNREAIDAMKKESAELKSVMKGFHNLCHSNRDILKKLSDAADVIESFATENKLLRNNCAALLETQTKLETNI